MALTRKQVWEYQQYRNSSLRSSLKPVKPDWYEGDNVDYISMIIDQFLEQMHEDDPSKQEQLQPDSMVENHCCECNISTGFSSHSGVSRCGDCTRKLYGGYKFTNSSSDTLYINPDELTSEHKALQPKRSLTYAEALECEKVRIEWPTECYQAHTGTNPYYKRYQGDYWLVECLQAFDLADRRGYFMERVE